MAAAASAAGPTGFAQSPKQLRHSTELHPVHNYVHIGPACISSREERDETNGVPWKMRGKSDNFTADNPEWIREPRVCVRVRVWTTTTLVSSRLVSSRVIWVM